MMAAMMATIPAARFARLAASLGLCGVLSACVSGDYYRPDVPAAESQSLGASCSSPYRQVRRTLSEGVVLEVAPPHLQVSSPLSVLLRIGKGHRVRLLDDRLRIATLDDGGEQIIRVTAIFTGWPANAPPQPDYPPEQRYAALDPLMGLGRSDAIRPGWGVYSEFFGGGDVFRLQLDASMGRPRAFEVRLPAIEVDGRSVDVAPIRFETARGSSFGCVQ